jgi:hypothetical protein
LTELLGLSIHDAGINQSFFPMGEREREELSASSIFAYLRGFLVFGTCFPPGERDRLVDFSDFVSAFPSEAGLSRFSVFGAASRLEVVRLLGRGGIRGFDCWPASLLRATMTGADDLLTM